LTDGLGFLLLSIPVEFLSQREVKNIVEEEEYYYYFNNSQKSDSENPNERQTPKIEYQYHQTTE
jgi:hypothetical protein